MCHGPEASKAPGEAVEAAAEFQARAPPLTRQPLPNTHSNTRAAKTWTKNPVPVSSSATRDNDGTYQTGCCED